jgi:hypothetical protein
VGLLDEFVAPTRKLIEEQKEEEEQERLEKSRSTTLNLDSYDDDDDRQFIENVEDVPKLDDQTKLKNNKNIIFYDNDENDFDNDPHAQVTHTDENVPTSPSLPDSPDAYQPHDDNDIVYEPSRHVDYLSHNWKESDISKSWRYIVLKRKDVANSARLENASWRTWAQAKYHLKTVSPESVNWLKDSDVTWLYGPIYKEYEQNEDVDKKYGSDGESSTLNAIKREKKKKQQKKEAIKKGPKPILKKRTVSEMLTQPSMIVLAHHHHHGRKSPIDSHGNTPSPPVFEDDFDLISKRVNAQYSKLSGLSETTESAQSKESTTIEESEKALKRHIHFNDRVEQCISINPPDSEDEYADNDYDYEDGVDDESDDDSEEEGGFFLMVKSPSSAQLHNREFTSMSDMPKEDIITDDTSSLATRHSTNKYQTIELLPATTLNYGSDEDEESDDEEQFVVSHRTNTGRGYNYHYDYNSVYQGNADHLVHVGDQDYELEDTPQHLEGVKMIDVPDDIVLGSNVEVVDAAEFVNATHDANPQSTTSKPSKGGAFAFHSDSGSDSEEGEQFRETTSSPPLSVTSKNSLPKVSSSPSYASLSDVAAQGFIQRSGKSDLSGVLKSKTDLEELQRDFNTLSSSSENDTRGLKSAILNSWKKNN